MATEAPAATYLMLCDPRNGCCAAVAASLRTRGERAVVVPNPLAAPATFSWRLDSRVSDDFRVVWTRQYWEPASHRWWEPSPLED